MAAVKCREVSATNSVQTEHNGMYRNSPVRLWCNFPLKWITTVMKMPWLQCNVQIQLYLSQTISWKQRRTPSREAFLPPMQIVCDSCEDWLPEDTRFAPLCPNPRQQSRSQQPWDWPAAAWQRDTLLWTTSGGAEPAFLWSAHSVCHNIQAIRRLAASSQPPPPLSVPIGDGPSWCRPK